MTGNRAGILGIAVALFVLWMFFFHVVGLFIVMIAVFLGYPTGRLIAWWARRKRG